jgi:hypothetical protein
MGRRLLAGLRPTGFVADEATIAKSKWGDACLQDCDAPGLDWIALAFLV